MRRLYSLILSIRVGTLIGWGFRILTWLAVPLSGLFVWIDTRGDVPLTPAGVWKAARQDWESAALIVVVTVLVWLDPGRKILRQQRTFELAEASADYATMALEQISNELAKQANRRSFERAYEQLLISACHALADALDLEDVRAIKTNLLLLAGDRRITVVARSVPGSPAPVEVDIIDDLPAARAMKDNQTVVMCHVRKSVPAAADRPYDCVGATPIVKGERSYGALTVDSNHGTILRGKEAMIDRTLRPYCGLVECTLREQAPTWECKPLYKR